MNLFWYEMEFHIFPFVAQLVSHAACRFCLQNVAFLSFLFFTIVQFFFAVLARSQSMMADCAAMSVDVISYFVNWCAERLKHGHSSLSPEQLRLKRLYLELIPPGISVITLIVVTVMALQLAIETLVDAYRGKNNGAPPPDVGLVLLFSGLNLGLDFFNVMFFAKADQAVGIPGQHGNEDIHVHFDSHHHPEHAIATEATPLVDSKSNGNTINPHDADTLSSRDSESVVETKGLNLNMCSAWTVSFTSLFSKYLSTVKCLAHQSYHHSLWISSMCVQIPCAVWLFSWLQVFHTCFQSC